MDNVTRIGRGGRLYRDARKAGNGHSEEDADVKEVAAPADETKTDYSAPPPPMPWTVKPMYEPPKPQRDWQEIQSTMLELAGIGVLTYGFSLLYLWLGLVVLGICLIALGIAVGLPAPLKRPEAKS